MDLEPRITHPNRKCDPDYNKTFNLIGKTGLRRLDGWEKVSGSALFGSDFVFPGTLYARVLSCPYANATIKSMDTSAAEAYPGVRKVVRFDEASNPYIGVLALTTHGYFEGDPIGAAVIADTDEIAQDALRLIKVEWDVLPFSLEYEDSVKPDCPLIVNPRGFSQCADVTQNFLPGPATGIHTSGNALGDVQAGFAEADKTITFTTYKAENHARIEPIQGSYWCKDDHYEYANSGQLPAGPLITAVTGTRNTYTHPVWSGGSFGHGYAVAILNAYFGAFLGKLMDGVPVKVMFDLQQSNFYTMANDCGTDTFKVGFKNDGTITAVQEDSAYNVTTYEPGLMHFEENTCVPNLLCNYKSAWTNRPQGFACRSEQRICCVALNLATSRVADELGMDPTQIALKNDGAMGHGTSYLDEVKKSQGFPDRDSLKECIEVAKKAIDFDNVWHKPGTKILPDGRMHGVSFVWDHEWTDMTFKCQVVIVLTTGGKAEIIGHYKDVGDNAASTYCALAADEIGLKYEDVYLKANCEGHGVNLSTTSSACGMAVNGFAVKKAAQQLKSQILYIAVNGNEQDIFKSWEVDPPMDEFPALFPGKTVEQLDVKDGYIFEIANPENKKPVSSVAITGRQVLTASTAHAPLTAWGWYSAGIWGSDAPLRERMTRQAHFVEVAVDTETGEIEVLKVVNVNDVGKAVSPETVSGQQYGGTIMGVSRGKYEESIYDPATGVKLNANLLDYKISTFADCGPIDTHIVETALGYGPYGCVGVGEGTADLIPGSIGPAVQNAIGVWIDDYPITPDKVLKALGKA